MRRPWVAAQTRVMSNPESSTLTGFSEQLVELVAGAAKGVAAVKAAPYRVVSGVALTSDLLAVTDHTLKREERIGIVLAGGHEGTATLVGRAPGLDVALLRVEQAPLTPLEAASAALQAGALAAVVGFTADVGPSASLGIFGAVGGQRRMWRGSTLEQFLRLDVNLYPSQSGAAVVDMHGRLVGLATPALLRHSAVAVPYSTLQKLADELVKEGRIRQGYLGVGLQTVAIPASLREKTGSAAESGLMLLSVEAGSAAEHSGLQLGDILLSLGGHATPDSDDLQAVLRGEAVGQTLQANLVRGGELLHLPVLISERKPAGRKGE